ncbi:MAG: MmcQ/YjbR family DNA-binding protein [Pseudomonadota bacterium]
MTPDEIKAHCLSLPDAACSLKWGDDHCYTIAEKMFCAHGPDGKGLSFKCTPDAFEMLVESGVAEPAKYLARAKWVTVQVEAVPDDELKARLTQAYTIVRSKLPKKTQSLLAPFEP